jgi:hypothetical protein
MSDATHPVVTRSNRGQWENTVEGRPEVARSYSSKEEAVDEGRALADELGVHHVVEDAEPTGAITDPQED